MSKSFKAEVDLTEAMKVTGTLEHLQGSLNNEGHLNAMTKSAYEIMRSAFNLDTALLASGQPENYYHVYEPGHPGEVPFQLFRVRMSGRAGNRNITWDWRASHLTVDPVNDARGGDRWVGVGPEFDRKALNRVHVFVWRAPVMEYGVQVTVRPKMQGVKLLVFPNREVNGGAGGATFTPSSYTFTPGEQVQGNFTAWFAGWWGEGRAEESLTGWSQQTSQAFVDSFAFRIKSAIGTGGSIRGSSFTVDSAAAREGKIIAELISGDLKRNYLGAAAQRKAFRAGADSEE